MSEHPKITAAREAFADTQRRAEADLAARIESAEVVGDKARRWELLAAWARARRAWKSAANRKANAVERAIRVYGGDDAE